MRVTVKKTGTGRYLSLTEFTHAVTEVYNTVRADRPVDRLQCTSISCQDGTARLRVAREAEGVTGQSSHRKGSACALLLASQGVQIGASRAAPYDGSTTP